MIDIPRAIDIIRKLVHEPMDFLDHEDHVDLDDFILRVNTLRHAGATLSAHGFGYMDIEVDRSFVLRPTFEVADKFGSTPQERFAHFKVPPPMIAYDHWVKASNLIDSVCSAFALAERKNQRVETVLLRSDLREPAQSYTFLSRYETWYVELPPGVAIVTITTWPEDDLWNPSMFGIVFDRTTRTA